MVGIVWSTLYDVRQFCKEGARQYLSDEWNVIDVVYIGMGISQIVVHRALGPFHWLSKIQMLIVILIAVNKTFFFLRIFKSYSAIVTMLKSVANDLVKFLIFFIILLVGLSLNLNILQLGNIEIDNNFRRQ